MPVPVPALLTVTVHAVLSSELVGDTSVMLGAGWMLSALVKAKLAAVTPAMAWSKTTCQCSTFAAVGLGSVMLSEVTCAPGACTVIVMVKPGLLPA